MRDGGAAQRDLDDFFGSARRALFNGRLDFLGFSQSDSDVTRAVADNRRLWEAVHGAVIDPTNALPVPLRAQIAGVALAVLRECDRPAPDLGFVAEMNDQFAAGLWR
jgi:hypothetical protein